MAAEEAVASFDHRHRFVASATYAVPGFGGIGLRRGVGRGWQLNAIVLLESGAPFTVNIGTDRANIGAGPAQRPDMTCDPNEGGREDRTTVVQHGLFALQPQFTFGNAPRNAVLSPGYANVDLGIQKNVTLGRRHGAAVTLGDFQSAEPDQLRRPQPRRVHAQFRPDLQHEATPPDAVRRQAHVLISVSSGKWSDASFSAG